MSAWVSIDGQVLPGAEARISVFDRGFLFGDSIYEVLRTVRGRPVFWNEHIERMRSSARVLRLDADATLALLRADTDACLARAEAGERYIRLIVTRGVGDLALEPTDARAPGRVVIVKPLPAVPRLLLEEGCALTVFQTGRQDVGGVYPDAKSGNKLLAVLGQAQAQAAGAYEALRVDPLGRVLEGTRSTFFLVRGGVLLTPPLEVGILAGITRGKILGLARALDLPVREARIQIEELEASQEAFITSTSRGIVPVQRCDQAKIGPPGPMTRRLMRAYAELIESPTS